jgi:hypothetical protein
MFCRIRKSARIFVTAVVVPLSLAVLMGAPTVTLAAKSAPGVYELSFDTTGPVPLTADDRLPVGEELIPKAHVQDISGAPAHDS